MEKNIKDYLHLYLGCDVMCIAPFFNEERKFTVKGLLIWVGEHEGKVRHNNDQVMTYHKKEIAPILRPLSDMTEEEAIELAKLSEWEPHFLDVKVERNKYKDLVVTWDGMAESRELFNATGEMFYCPEQFQWLLSKGFDLFELIYYKLAIDKTTLTPPIPEPVNS